MDPTIAMKALRAGIRFSNEICAIVENPCLAPVWRASSALDVLKRDVSAMQALVDALGGQKRIEPAATSTGRGDVPAVRLPFAGRCYEIRQLLNDLLDWEASMGGFEAPVWDRARAIRDSLFAADP